MFKLEQQQKNRQKGKSTNKQTNVDGSIILLLTHQQDAGNYDEHLTFCHLETHINMFTHKFLNFVV